MDALIKKLDKFVKAKPVNALLLASALGYRTAETVKKWIARGSIPSYRQSDVISFLEEKANEHFS